MTEAALIESLAMYQGLFMGWLSLYFTALTAYLVTAYIAGSKLTTVQTAFISAGFLVLTSLFALGAYGTGIHVVVFADEMKALNASRKSAASFPVIYTTIVLLICGILGSPKFMWDVRHPRTE
ncbi:hypothetical protein R0135_01265 [Congregibacter variabilis]|uniref:Uncharacterized protein n=1 Tax=Congregibacter variabilis TaxID=3081200 RepID=A0ABZ0I444_9GAMM|nr:hypothetical protein R0135_01265 [Congregibacter sp. IMCC43200]